MKRFLALIMGALALLPMRRRGIPRAADHRDRRLLAGRRHRPGGARARAVPREIPRRRREDRDRHRAGAGGEVGFTALANAPPDGYTIGFVNTPPLMTIPIERAAQFGGPHRFELLGNIVDDPCNFAVHSDTPVRTLQELAPTRARTPAR